MSDQLRAAFLAGLGPRAAAFSSAPGLAQLLERIFADVRTAWPQAGAAGPFMAHLARHAGGDLASLEKLRAADLYLAFACAQHERWALTLFEKRLMPKALVAARSIDREGALEADVHAVLHERLLVGSREKPARIAEYAGTGPLENWVRSVAIRTAMNLLPRHPPHDTLDAAVQLAGADPELDFLKRQYRAEFKSAFEAALTRLSDEDVNLLRLHVIDRLSIDKLCGLYQVHRATAARRIQKAREELCELTRVELAARLGLKGRELDSVMRLVRSNVDLSISRLLAPRVNG